MPAFPPVAVTIAKPVEREIVNYAEFTGNTAAVKSVDIRARVSGYLDKVGFDEGAVVKSGDMLFVIDPRPYQAALDMAQANVEQAQAQLQLAESNFKRAEDLQKKGVISPQDYETQSANRNQALVAVSASAVHARSDAVGHHRHRGHPGRQGDGRAAFQVPPGADLHEHAPGGRDQPHAAQDA